MSIFGCMTRLGAVAVIAFGLSAAASNASAIYANSVVEYNKGSVKGVQVPSRYIAANALGGPDGNFVSLGRGGSIVLGFAGKLFSGPASIIEVTFFDPAKHFESANVFGGLAGAWTLLKNVVNTGAQAPGFSIAFNGVFDQIKIVDMTPKSSPSFDGWDLDAVSVSPIPLPATGLLLLSGLGVVSVLRRGKS